MVAVGELLRLAGAALGAVGGVLVFVEFFQTPTYVEYDRRVEAWEIRMTPDDVREHTWLGRVGGILVAAGFTLLFVGQLTG